MLSVCSWWLTVIFVTRAQIKLNESDVEYAAKQIKTDVLFDLQSETSESWEVTSFDLANMDVVSRLNYTYPEGELLIADCTRVLVLGFRRHAEKTAPGLAYYSQYLLYISSLRLTDSASY